MPRELRETKLEADWADLINEDYTPFGQYNKAVHVKDELLSFHTKQEMEDAIEAAGGNRETAYKISRITIRFAKYILASTWAENVVGLSQNDVLQLAQTFIDLSRKFAYIAADETVRKHAFRSEVISRWSEEGWWL